MTGKEVSLEEDEVLVYTDTMTTFGANTLVLNHVPLRVKAELDDLPLAPKRKDPAQPTVHLVCRDKEVMLHLAEILDMENQTLIYEQSFNITGGEEAAAAFSQAVKDAQDAIPGLRSDSQYLAKTSWYASFGGFLFIGIFLGLLFMMAAVLIIYYKQISEGYDDHDRFAIMPEGGHVPQGGAPDDYEADSPGVFPAAGRRRAAHRHGAQGDGQDAGGLRPDQHGPDCHLHRRDAAVVRRPVFPGLHPDRPDLFSAGAIKAPRRAGA